jgi:hypothetical protein
MITVNSFLLLLSCGAKMTHRNFQLVLIQNLIKMLEVYCVAIVPLGDWLPYRKKLFSSRYILAITGHFIPPE